MHNLHVYGVALRKILKQTLGYIFVNCQIILLPVLIWRVNYYKRNQVFVKRLAYLETLYFFPDLCSQAFEFAKMNTSSNKPIGMPQGLQNSGPVNLPVNTFLTQNPQAMESHQNIIANIQDMVTFNILFNLQWWWALPFYGIYDEEIKKYLYLS